MSFSIGNLIDHSALASPIQLGNELHTGAGNDNVHVSKTQGFESLLGDYRVDINGKPQYMSREQLANTRFELGDGNDTLLVDKNVDVGVHADGGRGSDVLVGGSGNDVLSGGPGVDLLIGRGGQDRLGGRYGADALGGGDNVDGSAARGNDQVAGGQGWGNVFGAPFDFDIQQW